jgi:hypothetical protein
MLQNSVVFRHSSRSRSYRNRFYPYRYPYPGNTQ